MKTLSKSLWTLAGAMLLSVAAIAWVGSNVQAGADDVKDAKPEVLAVKFHADWCGSCKTIAPSVAELQRQFDGKSVLFVTFDLTDDSTKRQARLMASALGVDKAFVDHAPKTGYVLLIDADSKRVLEKLTKKQDAAAMGKKLTQAVRTASL